MKIYLVFLCHYDYYEWMDYQFACRSRQACLDRIATFNNNYPILTSGCEDWDKIQNHYEDNEITHYEIVEDIIDEN